MWEHSIKTGSSNCKGRWFIYQLNKRGGWWVKGFSGTVWKVPLFTYICMCFHPGADGQSNSWLEAPPKGYLWQLHSHVPGLRISLPSNRKPLLRRVYDPA